MKVISVAEDFTRYPSGRTRKGGDTSGEAFRQDFLEPPLSRGETVLVKLDGTIGYGSSFLEEAFGGLVRALKMDAEVLLERLKLESSDSFLVEEVLQYIRDESGRLHRRQ